jgi:hypothetical protein
MPRQGGALAEKLVPPVVEPIPLPPPPAASHLIELRASAPFPWGQYYVTLLVGRERRSNRRLRAERQTRWTRQVVVYFLLLSILLALVTGYLVILYVIKSALGINIFPGSSPFHFVYEMLYG